MKQSKFTFSFTLLVLICETNRFPAESFSLVCLSEHLYKAGAVEIRTYFRSCFSAQWLHISCYVQETLRTYIVFEHGTLWDSLGPLEWKEVTRRRDSFMNNSLQTPKDLRSPSRTWSIVWKETIPVSTKGKWGRKSKNFPQAWSVITNILGDRQSWNRDLHLLNHK